MDERKLNNGGLLATDEGIDCLVNSIKAAMNNRALQKNQAN